VNNASLGGTLEEANPEGSVWYELGEDMLSFKGDFFFLRTLFYVVMDLRLGDIRVSIYANDKEIANSNLAVH
jgi:hypothetical protein